MLFLLSGLLAFVSIPTQPGHGASLTIIGAADLACGTAAWSLPWHRWRPVLTALLAVPAFGVLAVSTWVFGGFAAGTGPFFILLFAWLGLHHSPVVIVGSALPGTVAYLGPLVAVDSSPRVLSSVLVMMPVAVGIGLAIASQVRQLREERDRATRAEAWRSALMATLAHDIRSPLTAVQGTLMLLQEMPDLPAERRNRMVEGASRQTKRLTRLATGLLDLDRVEHGSLRLDRRWVSVSGLAIDAATLAATGYDVTVRVDPGLRVFADPDRLEQVLVNLIGNAVRHGRPPIQIDAERVDDVLRLEIRDHGPGVPSDRAATLFQRLGGQGGHPESVGLGMWIVRLLVEAHSGAVAYEPADPGARFVVLLPFDQSAGAVSLQGAARQPR